LFCGCPQEETPEQTVYLADKGAIVKLEGGSGAFYDQKDGYWRCYVGSQTGKVTYQAEGSAEVLEYNYTLTSDKQKFTIPVSDTKALDVLFIRLKPFLIITYDDVSRTDYPVYNRHKAISAELGLAKIVPAEIGINLFNLRGMTIDSLEKMVNDGWEIVNHGYSHSYLNAVKTSSVLTAGSNQVYSSYGRYNQDGAEITINGDVYTVASHFTGDDGNQYITIVPPAIKDYDAGAVIQLSDTQLEIEILRGIREMERQLSTQINHFTYPYTTVDNRCLVEIQKHYLSARQYNGEINNPPVKNMINPGCNKLPLTNVYHLNSADFIINYTEEEIETILDKVVVENYVLIQFSHTWDVNFSHDKLEWFIKKTIEKGIAFTTRSKLWEYYEL
jgi:peptidoglycan/xylan/chitin deacetylase (PgdA/CDA1 family)